MLAVLPSSPAILVPMKTNGILASDTCVDAQRIQVELWRRMSPLEKMRAVTQISQAVQDLSLAGIRSRHPAASDEECMLRLAILKLGPELAFRVYPEAAGLARR